MFHKHGPVWLLIESKGFVSLSDVLSYLESSFVYTGFIRLALG